jgi:transposase-like protein
MRRVSSRIRDITPARRGQIIQHVMVEGWSPAQAAAVYGVTERQVARWVDAYRRYGMASLRDETAADGPRRRWRSRLRGLAARIAAALYGDPERHSAHCIALRRRGDRDPRPDPDRRSLWN